MKYELLYLIPATKTEQEVATAHQEVTTLLGSYASSVSRNELIGKRKLAYPIRQVRYGYYALVCFEAETEKMTELDRELRHSSDVLRHLIVKALPTADTAKVELTEYQVPDVYARRKRASKEEKPRISREEVVEEAQEQTGAEPAAQAPTMTSEQIDRKIDDILEADIDKA